MKKVAFMIPDLRGGGAEKVLIDILNNIDKTKFKITLVLLEKEGVYIDQIPNDIEVIVAKDKFKMLPRKIWTRWIKYFPKKFYKYIIKDKYDTEIAFMEGFTTKLVANSNNCKSKKIAWVHTDLMKFHWTKRIYKNKEEDECYKKFNEIIYVSNDSKESFEKLFNTNNINKKVIYNPIIENEIMIKSKKFDVKFDDFTIVSVGRLIQAKGYDRLIRVHAELIEKYPHKLLILGEGKERLNLEKIIKDLNVEKTVKLNGFTKNPYPYIKNADIFVSSSRVEGYPLVVAESIILEKAILATETTGPKEILSNGKYGIMCKNSKDGIKQELIKIFKNKEYIEKYENKSKERKKYFDYRSIIKEIETTIS